MKNNNLISVNVNTVVLVVLNCVGIGLLIYMFFRINSEIEVLKQLYEHINLILENQENQNSEDFLKSKKALKDFIKTLKK